MLFLNLYCTSLFIENFPYKYSDSALLEKRKNRAVNKRTFEKNPDGVETISFGGARCGLFHARFVSLDLIEGIQIINHMA